MIISSLRLILRNLFSQKVYTLINLTGLSIGLGGAFILILFVFNELGYNRFNRNLDQVYKINTEAYSHEMTFAKAPFVLGTTLRMDLPQEFILARTFNVYSSNILHNNELIKEEHIFSADPEIFDILTFKLRSGSIEGFDGSPNAAVITEGMAERYFGTEDPLGKSISLENNGEEFVLDVVAVIDDLPVNSSFRPELLISHEIALKQMDQLISTSRETPYGSDFFATSWSMYLFFTTYILVPEAHLIQTVESLMQTYEGEHFGKELSIQFHLQKYADIYLESGDLDGFYDGGNGRYVFICALVALLLILTATLNYILLSTSIMRQRRSEMGLKLIHGAGRSLIVRQILLETTAFVFLAMIIGLTLAELLLPKVSLLLFGKLLTINYLYNWGFSMMVLLLSLFIGILSGTLLSLNVLAQMPVELIRYRETRGGGRRGLTKVLNTVQLIVSITLIICTATIYLQLRYFTSSDMGFELEDVISINVGDEELKSSYPAIKERVGSLPGVVTVSGSMWAPPTRSNMRMTISRFDTPEERIQAQGLMVDYHIVETLGMRLVEGRDFDPDLGSEAGNLIINEQAVGALGIDSSAIGFQTSFGTIIGVVEDFHIHSLHNIVPPMIIQFMPGGVRTMLVKLDPFQGDDAIRMIEEICHDFASDKPMDYAFLVDTMEELYNEEKRFVSVMTIFSGLNLFISLLGIFGMSRLATGRRTREVGIRKVMGAESSQVLRRFLYEYVVVAVVACLVAFPAGYFLMTRWLSNFEYHGKISPVVFLLAGAVSILVVILTVSYHVTKAANTNPIDAIRYE